MRPRNQRFADAISYLCKIGWAADQKDFAEKTGISPVTVSRILNDRVKSPSPETIERLLSAYPKFDPKFFSGDVDDMIINNRNSSGDSLSERMTSVFTDMFASYERMMNEVKVLSSELQTSLNEITILRQQLQSERDGQATLIEAVSDLKQKLQFYNSNSDYSMPMAAEHQI